MTDDILLIAPELPNPFPKQALVFTCLLETLWKKGEIARNEQFLLFPQCLPLVSVIFIKFKIIVWKLFQFERV